MHDKDFYYIGAFCEEPANPKAPIRARDERYQRKLRQ